MIDLSRSPAIGTLVAKLLESWPEHRNYLEASFATRPRDVIDVSEAVASAILRLAHGLPDQLDRLCEDYRFLCTKIVLPEELYFRRHHAYRVTSFAEAYRECYGNRELMARYMNGLLLSNLFWENHARAIAQYVNAFLPSLPEQADHLEIGPGHGLLLAFAAQRASIATASGWDISETSIEATREALALLQVERPVRLQQRDLFNVAPDAAAEQFDAIVLSEILEHLEDPAAALRLVWPRLRPGGRVWVNVPVNSPAPDHIYLLRTPEEACDLVASAGFEIVESCFFPMTGATLERARRQQLSISCVITGRRPLNGVRAN